MLSLTTKQLTLYSHGDRLHFEMLTLASETSLLLRANCQNKLLLAAILFIPKLETLFLQYDNFELCVCMTCL